MRPYFTNKAKELIKNPKVYLVDTGLRHAVLQNFALIPQTVEFGYAVENTVMTELFKVTGLLDQLRYWRTKSGQEVDIVLKHETMLTPIEVKSGDTATIPSPLKSFIREYHPTVAYVLNWSLIRSLIYEGCTVYFRPLWFPIV